MQANVGDATGLAFACLPGCGFCCATSPLVHAHEAAALGALVVEGRIPVRAGTHACSALGSDRNCTVYAARPAACRLYPFMVHAGRRVQVTMALACPGVGEGGSGGKPRVGVSPQVDAQAQAQAAAALALARPGASDMAARAKETFGEFDRRMKEWNVFTAADKLRSAFSPHVDALATIHALPAFFAGIAEGDLLLARGDPVGDAFDADPEADITELLAEAARDAFDAGAALWVEPENGFSWMAPKADEVDVEALPLDWTSEGSAVLAAYLRRLLTRDHTEGAAMWLVDASGYQATPAAAYARVLGEAALHVALRAGMIAQRKKRDEIDAALAWRGVRAYETSYHSLPTLGSIL